MAICGRRVVSWKKIAEFLFFILYKVLFRYFFVNVYSDIYSISAETSGMKQIVGWLVYILVVALSIVFLRGYYSLAFKFLFIFAGMSTCAVYEFRDVAFSSFLKASVYWLGLLLVFSFLSQAKRNSNQAELSNDTGHPLHIALFLLCVLAAMYLSGRLSGFRLVLSFDDVATYRREILTAYFPATIRYLLSLVGGTLLPYYFGYFLSKRSYTLTCLALFGGILVFSINGMKTWLLVYLLIFLVFLSYRFNGQHVITYILIFMCLWIPISIFQYDQTGRFNLLALLGRTIYIPSQIGYDYIDFFDANEYLYLRESLLRFFFRSPYPFGSSYFIVGGYATTATTAQANNGLWGDAYANFGFLGLLIYPGLLGLVIHGYRKAMEGYDERLSVAVLFSLLWTAISNSLFTWLLTGGVFVVVLISRVGRKAQ